MFVFVLFYKLLFIQILHKLCCISALPRKETKKNAEKMYLRWLSWHLLLSLKPQTGFLTLIISYWYSKVRIPNSPGIFQLNLKQPPGFSGSPVPVERENRMPIPVEECSSSDGIIDARSNLFYYGFFIAGQALAGIGAAALWTIGKRDHMTKSEITIFRAL